MEQTGQDGIRLLPAVRDPRAPSWLRQISFVEALRRFDRHDHAACPVRSQRTRSKIEPRKPALARAKNTTRSALGASSRKLTGSGTTPPVPASKAPSPQVTPLRSAQKSLHRPGRDRP